MTKQTTKLYRTNCHVTNLASHALFVKQEETSGNTGTVVTGNTAAQS